MASVFVSLVLFTMLSHTIWANAIDTEPLLKMINAGDVAKFVKSARSSPETVDKWRIINGADAVPGSIPHQVSLQWVFFGLRFLVCGGSVIAENVVLTAAHCVDGFGPDDVLQVVVYDHNLVSDDGTEQIINVTRIYMNHDYYPTIDFQNKVFPHDIALLILQDNVKNTAAIIKMADDYAPDFQGETCTISGWGVTADGGIPNTLQQVNMTALSRDECMEYWGPYGSNIFDGQICIFGGSDNTTGASACNGDSGGPMVCNGVLAGVTSWGIIGCRLFPSGEFVPSVYARVSYYYPWIQMILQRFGTVRHFAQVP